MAPLRIIRSYSAAILEALRRVMPKPMLAAQSDFFKPMAGKVAVAAPERKAICFQAKYHRGWNKNAATFGRFDFTQHRAFVQSRSRHGSAGFAPGTIHLEAPPASAFPISGPIHYLPTTQRQGCRHHFGPLPSAFRRWSIPHPARGPGDLL